MTPVPYHRVSLSDQPTLGKVWTYSAIIDDRSFEINVLESRYCPPKTDQCFETRIFERPSDGTRHHLSEQYSFETFEEALKAGIQAVAFTAAEQPPSAEDEIDEVINYLQRVIDTLGGDPTAADVDTLRNYLSSLVE